MIFVVQLELSWYLACETPGRADALLDVLDQTVAALSNFDQYM